MSELEEGSKPFGRDPHPSIADEPTEEAVFELRRRETLPLDTLLAELRAQQKPGPNVALDAIAYGIEGLDAILVIDLDPEGPHAAWIRPDTAIRADVLAPALRDAYRTAQVVTRHLTPFGARSEPSSRGAQPAGEPPSTLVTIELASRTAVARRIRGFVVACLFDAGQPIGLARLVARRIAATLEPELPLEGEAPPPSPQRAPETRVSAALVDPSAIAEPPPTELAPEAHPPPPVIIPRTRTSIPPPRATQQELDRARRLLHYVDEHAPEPHVARMRLALRAGITPLALEHAEALGPDAVILIETAVEEMFGLARDELRGVV